MEDVEGDRDKIFIEYFTFFQIIGTENFYVI